MELMNQPITGQLGNRLIELLDSSDYHTLNIIVAFAKNSGVLRIKDAFERFRERGGIVNTYVGVDMGGTSYEALTALLLHTDSLNIVHSENSQTFHPKIYQFLGKDKGLIVVGSHNLTAGGLWTNFESSVLIPLDELRTNNTLTVGLNDYIGQLTSLKDSFMSIDKQDDIDKLLQNGYVSKEIEEQMDRLKANKQNKSGERLFGNSVPAKLPRIAMPKEKRALTTPATPVSTISTPLSGKKQTIWFETRKLTGGSRNILDLSMKSLLDRGDPTGTSFDLGDPRFMRGAVTFFGLEPTATDQTQDITLNFEGIDYSNNTILFPPGESSNKTWRLQIKGVSSSGRKITEAFRATGESHYLVEKLITFTKIQDNYYSMSVLPESELESFKVNSRILARNGASKTSKWLGLL